MITPRITVSLTCFGRPERTKRAIQCILDQDINDWEAFIMGDNCPHFQELIDSGYLQKIKEEQALKGNTIHYFNADVNHGGWGHFLTNHAIQNATGNFFIFLDNDDVILSNHMHNYLSEIENTHYVLAFNCSFLAPLNYIRESQMTFGLIGHCDIIVKTSIAKIVAPHNATYAHDWNFIDEVSKHGECKKSYSKIATYNVMRLGSEPIIETID